MEDVFLAASMWKLAEVLCKALEIDERKVRRIIIDCDATRPDPAVVYIEMWASNKILELDWSTHLEGAKIEILGRG